MNTLRRVTTKRQCIDKLARDNLDLYIANGYTGTDTQAIHNGTAQPAPQPGNRNRSGWKPFHKPFGPIGILLCQAHEKAAAISTNFEVHTYGWPPTRILDGPYCELKPFATRVAVAARAIASTDARNTATDLHDIDPKATNCSSEHDDRGNLGLLRMVQQGAGWARNHANKIGHEDGDKCEHCGAIGSNIAHIIWKCPRLQDQREALTDDISTAFNTDHLRPSMLHGIAPVMIACPDVSFWGGKLNESDLMTKRILGCKRIYNPTHEGSEEAQDFKSG